jgi:hypothetical protein
MGGELLTERYHDQIVGVLSCYDRLLLQGTLPGLCFAGGMGAYLGRHNVRIMDYPRWAEPLRDQLRDNAERLAAENGLTIEHIRKTKTFRKEAKVKEVLAHRGEHPGLVWIFSAMEPCESYKPWYDKANHHVYLKPDSGKCLHYYFYFIDEQLGLCFVRVPTWCPFRLQIYTNGRNWLAAEMRKRGIRFRQLENAFVDIRDFASAQSLADGFRVKKLHRKLDQFTQRFCPVIRQLGVSYHWSINQAEYATDVVFRRQSDLQAIYEHLTRVAIHAIKADKVATFLGRKLFAHYQDEVGNRFDIRIQGTRIKHTMGPVSIKMYDKFGLILRIETTVNDVTFFPHYREVEQRDGQRVQKWAEMKRNIYSLPILQERLFTANWRYLEFISAIEDRRAAVDKLDRFSLSVHHHERSYPGFNLFQAEDRTLMEALLRGEYNIRGLRNKDLREHLPGKSPGQISRLLKRLRLHGILRKAGRAYRYCITSFGRQALTLALKLRELVIIPGFAGLPAS